MVKGAVIGVEISAPEVRIGRIKGEKVQEESLIRIDTDLAKDVILDEISTSIENLINDDVVGIGVGVPSIVDVKNGIVYEVSRIPSWNEVHLRAHLESKFSLPVYVNNDANCFATGVKHFGKGKNFKNIIGLIIGEGMGAGVIVENKLFSGSNCGVGEFGKLPFKDSDYESYCSTNFFKEHNNITFSKALDLADKGDIKALRIFEKYGYLLGTAIKSILYTYDPEIIVLGGSAIAGYEYFKDSMNLQVNSFIFNRTIANIKIDVARQDNLGVLGAAALYYDANYNNDLNMMRENQIKIQSALTQAEKQYYKVFNNISDPIFIFDKRSHDFLDCNESVVQRIYGYSKKDLASMTPLDLHPKFEKERVQKNIDVNNPDKVNIYTHVTKSGKQFDVEIHSDDIEFNGREATISVVRDISERMAMERAANKRAAQGALVYEVGQRINSSLDLEQMLSEIVYSICDTFNYYGVMLMMLDEKQKKLILRSIAGGYEKVFPSDLSIQLGEGMIGAAAKSRAIQVSGDVTKDPNYVRKAEEVTKSEMSVPIISGKKVIGVLDMQSDRIDAFTESDTAVSWTLSTQIATAIENARLYTKAREEITERKQAESKLRGSRNNLRNAKRETDSILQNVEEGLLLLNSKFVIGTQYSKALEEILIREDLTGLTIIDILKDKIPEPELQNMKEFLELMFVSDVDEESLVTLNPLSQIEVTFPENQVIKHLSFNFRRIMAKNIIFELIVTVNDVTKQVLLAEKLEESRSQSKRQMDWLLSILHVEPQLLKEFIDSVNAELKYIDSTLRESDHQADFSSILEKVFRSMHLIKGNASVLDLKFFVEKAHVFEEKLSEIRNKPQVDGSDFVPLVLQLSDIRMTVGELNNLIKRISKIHSHFRPKRSYESEVFIKSIQNLVKNISDDLNKNIHLDHTEFDAGLIPYEYKLTVREIIIQLVRNAIYHGIETVEERSALKKPAKGVIKISNIATDQNIGFTFSDDGRGLQVDKLREKALNSGRWPVDIINNWNDQKIINTIFTTGISTLDRADLIAGRGVGLDIVKDKVGRMYGQIEVDYENGKYTEFKILFPFLTENQGEAKKHKESAEIVV